MTDPLSPAIPAATLVIFRSAAAGPPELLMVERARAMAFAGGAMVFPGGRVDPGDRAMAAAMPGDPDDAAARVAAIRETLEEAGLPVGVTPHPDPATLETVRDGLHAGLSFAGLLAAANLAIRPEKLVPFARWRPTHRTTRIFDTRFYLAEAPPGEPSVDATENVRLVWTSAAAMLAAADAGRASVIFPTRRNLERLARFGSFNDAVADAAAHPVRTIMPWEEEREGRRMICIPNDLGYPIVAEPVDLALRG